MSQLIKALTIRLLLKFFIKKPFSHNPSYQPLSNNKYNENNIYYRQNSDMGYADYQIENNQNIGSNNGTIDYENAIYP
ncbi:hypothetical protein [Arsenophonus endosymbiont of Bemisia tabaci]|uniref:hypothetical protein n=1 Tax=Arsenophonus endosymbiont of Bemisia tabaci TaxID=536059 RepID=UPI0015F3FFDB|nr:hypothetical protein [Arsenophonus endosymbiont of Bemisia tabaci]